MDANLKTKLVILVKSVIALYYILLLQLVIQLY